MAAPCCGSKVPDGGRLASPIPLNFLIRTISSQLETSAACNENRVAQGRHDGQFHAEERRPGAWWMTFVRRHALALALVRPASVEVADEFGEVRRGDLDADAVPGAEADRSSRSARG